MAEIPLRDLIDEIQGGLKNCKQDLDDADIAQDFYDGEGRRHMNLFARDAETPMDYIQRPYRSSSFTREVVGILTEHLYSPGPARKWDVPGGDEFLEQVYRDNHINAVMLKADQLSTLNDIAAVQVDAGDGVFADKPITLRLWGRQDFHCWTDPEDRRVVVAVCTRERYDQTTRYKLWTDEDVVVLETKKASETYNGGRVADVVEGPDPNTYGEIPFSFVHYEQPITRFFEVGISDTLVTSEIRINDRLSRLDESVNKHLNPMAIVENAPDGWSPIVGPMRFVRLNSRTQVSGTGGFEEAPPPKAYFLQAILDVAGAWDDLMKFINLCLEALRIPIQAVRMEQMGVASGISLVVEQAPLLTRARKRRDPFSVYESDLARKVLRCAGNHYGKSALVAAAKGELMLAWPMPSVPVPTDDNFQLLVSQVNAGILSIVMLAMQWFGCSREDAFQLFERIQEDNEELKARAPKLHSALQPEPDPDAQKNGQAPPPPEDVLVDI